MNRPIEPAQVGILVVDDDVISRNIFVNMLHWFGYRAYEAANEAEALVICRTPGIRLDLLIADFRLEGLTGVDLAARIRQHCPEVPILFTSGTPWGDWDVSARLRLSRLGGSIGFLPKPFPMNALQQKVRDLVAAG